jgi:hypothetical protein
VTDRNLQYAIIALLVILILGVTWIGLQIQPIARLTDSPLARGLGSIGS